jgi:hypothetical protein
MIENLQQSRGPAFGFAVHGLLTAADTQEVTTQLDHMIGNYKKPIGLLADLSQMEGADWTARWNEMRFLQRHTDQIARLAIVGVSDWEEIASMVLVATAALQGSDALLSSFRNFARLALGKDGQARRRNAGSGNVPGAWVVPELHP